MDSFVIVHTSVLTKSLIVLRAGTAIDINLKFAAVVEKCPYDYAWDEVQVAICEQKCFISSYGHFVIAIYEQESILRAYNMAVARFDAIHLEVFQIMAVSDHLELQRIAAWHIPAPKNKAVPYRPAEYGPLASVRKAANSAK